MRTIYFLKQHSRGNHSPQQVYFHGKTVFEGTKTDCKAELIRMRKFCKDKYRNTSTNDSLMEFINYEMSNMFFIRKYGDIIKWA